MCGVEGGGEKCSIHYRSSSGLVFCINSRDDDCEPAMSCLPRRLIVRARHSEKQKTSTPFFSSFRMPSSQQLAWEAIISICADAIAEQMLEAHALGVIYTKHCIHKYPPCLLQIYYNEKGRELGLFSAPTFLRYFRHSPTLTCRTKAGTTAHVPEAYC